MSAESIEAILDSHGDARRDELIPILQDVQEAQGFISEKAVVAIAERLNLPASKIYGVATFYNQFRFVKPGRFVIQLCRGTACHVKGSAKVLETVQRELGITAGQTTRDGLFTLDVVACVGACGLAPVMCVNGRFHAGIAPEDIKSVLDSYRQEVAEDERDEN